MISRRSLLLAGLALPATAYGQCITDRFAVDACRGGVRVTGAAALPPGATADLDFMTAGTLSPNVVFTRASVGTYFDATGTMQTAVTNAPRWDYDPVTHVLRGVLMEGPKTNLLLNSAALGTQSATVTAAATTLSFYGAGSIAYSGAAAGTLVGAGAFPQRASVTFTPTAGLEQSAWRSVLNALARGRALSIGWIPTVGATATRAAEHCALTDAVLFGGTTDRTVAVQGCARQVSAVQGVWVSVSDGSSANFMNVIAGANATNLLAQVNVGSVTKVNTGNTSYGTPPAVFKTALANGAIWNGAVNGAAMASSGGVSQQLGPLTVLRIGEGQLASVPAEGWIQRAIYWPRALSAAELAQVTT